MQMIRCAACGKRYNYLQEGCCPRCGAYNRPPRREWVEADGSIRHGDGSAPPRPGKVCYEKKVCHEEKQCFEGQARKAQKKPAAQPAAKNVHIPFKTRRAKGNAQPNSVGMAILGIVLFFIIIFIKNSGLLDKVNWDHSDRDNTNWSDSDWDSEPATPDVDYFNIEASCGDDIRISDDLVIQFLGYIADEDGRVYLFYWATDDDLATDLLESSIVLLKDGDGSGYPYDSVRDSYIIFNTFSPGVQWQTLSLHSDTGTLTVSDLYSLEDDSLMSWVDPADLPSL